MISSHIQPLPVVFTPRCRMSHFYLNSLKAAAYAKKEKLESHKTMFVCNFRELCSLLHFPFVRSSKCMHGHFAQHCVRTRCRRLQHPGGHVQPMSARVLQPMWVHASRSMLSLVKMAATVLRCHIPALLRLLLA